MIAGAKGLTRVDCVAIRIRAFTLLLVAVATASCAEPATSPPITPSLLPMPTLTERSATTWIEPFTAVPPTATEIPAKITGLSATSYTLPLTVQHVTETTAVVFFELESPSEGAVLISPLADPVNQQIVPFDSDIRQIIAITNLLKKGSSYTAYCRKLFLIL